MGWLTEMMSDFASVAGLRAVIDKAEEKIAAIEAERQRLSAENERLRAEVAALNVPPPAATPPPFAEASGVLWKSKKGGGYESTPCCPTCKSTLSDFSGSLLCLKCNWQAPLKSFEVPRVYHDLFGGP